MQNSTPQEVPVDKLRWRCDLSCIPYKTTNDISFKEQILGQERALKAIQMGLDIESPGYNIFVTGIAGTGRTTSVRRLLAKKKKKEDIPDDKCYVNNFRNPDSPRVISLPAGKGRAFKKDMFHLISYISKQIPVIFESDLYVKKRSEIIEKYNQKEQTIVRQFERKMNKEGFSLVQVQLGPVTKPDLLPIVDGKPVPFEQLNALVQEGKMEKAAFESLRDKYLQLIKEMPEMLKEVRKNQRAFRDDLLGLDAQFARDLIDPLIADIKEKFSSEHVDLYLDEVNEHILDTLDLFREKPEEENTTGKSKSANSAAFHDYQVNIVVDNADLKGAPVIFETTPTYKNLFGSIERIMDRNGQWRTDFTKIKAGSFLRASGGYLIINALDALLEQGVWQNLKRSLKNQCVVIQSIDPYFMVATSALKPQPIRTEVKVIMIGDPQIYQLLYYQDDDFKKIFKIRADFDNVMEKAQPSIEQYANFIKMICDDEKLSPFDTSAIAGVIEFGVKLAGRQNKISTRFNHIADLVREANYWAAQSAKKTVTGAHVDKALEAKIDRVSLIEDKIRELIQDGTIMIDTSGAEVGQVNGLSVIDLGDYAFGHPSRITAQTAMGRRGIVSIEREIEMSGPSHDKGVLILSGYLRGKYAQNKPLTVSASICFEQNYSGIDGDSASSTEIYALLSSLSGLPLAQNIAVTGSVNQKGEIQPIGGVNQKIEGFYYVCKAKRLTGTQGVMIPHLNVDDLMLCREVVAAVEKGKFHIYPVETIDQGIELLTGFPAGKRTKKGTYPEGSVNALVDAKLKHLAEGLRDFVGEDTE